MNAVAPTLTPRIIGEVESAHLAHLRLTLAPYGIDRERSIALNATAAGDGVAEVDALVRRLVGGLKITPEQAHEAVAALVADGLLASEGEDRVRATEAGQTLVAEVGAVAAGVIAGAYGGVPEADLAVAARVLTEITDRLNEQLVARLEQRNAAA
ncbi:winged helix DNA-binding protein [Streptacidiphilus rugosus]|uniref:winged helix DNA-binding protein n=1 Tax=Streptacidiphilus rugosus TaxID=405783 RepID=UPI0006923E72|nr:winged helix DNA-binding protein [Streptacidiphilus rugosus]